MRFFLAAMLTATAFAQMPDPPGQVSPGEKRVHEAYLFAHMVHGDYGHLYYSVSSNGLHWQMLHGGRRVSESYRGHADICQGHDRRYYLVGNRGDDQPDINFWVSSDLITWNEYSKSTPAFMGDRISGINTCVPFMPILRVTAPVDTLSRSHYRLPYVN